MTVVVVVGTGQDNRTVDIQTDETSLAVCLTDGRRFSTQLYGEVIPGATSVTYKGQRCIVRLQKRDPSLQWPQLEVCMAVGESYNVLGRLKEKQTSDMKEDCREKVT